jgi:hypothetical protein
VEKYRSGDGAIPRDTGESLTRCFGLLPIIGREVPDCLSMGTVSSWSPIIWHNGPVLRGREEALVRAKSITRVSANCRAWEHRYAGVVDSWRFRGRKV